MKTLYINKVYALALALVAALGFTACSDKLDEVPDNRTEIDSPTKVAKLLTSGYPTSSTAVLCELSGDNLVDDNVVVPATHNDAYYDFHDEAYAWEDINNYNTGTDDTPYDIWEAYYAGVAVCNHAIEAMQTMSDDPANDPDLAPYWGEAHVLRGYLHFVLVNVFAESYQSEAANQTNMGIPYVTKSEDKVNVNYGTSEFRHTVGETYALIEKDIQEGINLIDDGAYTVPAYHFNKRAANAFAARFYLFTRQYQKAYDYATAAIEASTLRNWDAISTATTNAMLNDYNDETLTCNYMIQATYSLFDRMLTACRYAVNDGSNSYGVPSTKDILIDGGGPNWSGRLGAYSGKLYRPSAGQEYGSFPFFVIEYFEYTDKIAGIGYVHMLYHPFDAGETMLVRAEAALYLGKQQQCISDLDKWSKSYGATLDLTLDRILTKYKRSGSNIYCSDLHPAEMGFEKVLSGDDLSILDCVLHFRRISTSYQGDRWYDIKRYGITVEHWYRGPLEDEVHHDVLNYNDPRRVLQIPNNVIKAGYPSTDRSTTPNEQNSEMTAGSIVKVTD